MIIQCPTCGQAYDTTGYPDNYQFACSCGAVIDVTLLMQQAQAAGGYAASTMRSQPPSAELAASSAHWTEAPIEDVVGESTAVSAAPPPPPGYQGYSQEQGDPLDHTLAPPTDLDLFASVDEAFEGSGESTAVTRNPYLESNPGSPSTLQDPVLGIATSYDPNQPTGTPLPANVIQDGAGDGVRPPSWDALPDSNDPLGADEEVHFDGERRLEPRAVWAMFFAVLIVTGPLAWLLGWRGRSHIRLAPGIIRGKGLATLAMLIGMTETVLMGGLLYATIAQPDIHPVVNNLGRLLGTVQPKTTLDTFAKRPKDPAVLSLQKARDLVEQYGKQRDSKRILKLQGFYLFQKGSQPFAHAYWYDERLNKTRHGMFLRSNRGHWHLVEVGIAYKEEARVSQTSSKQLTAATAKKLLQAFWRLRGRFTRTHIHQLYVVQQMGSRTAVVYWALHKQLSSQSIKIWKIRSHFRYSSAGEWHLCQYASPVPEDELHNFSQTASRTLEPEVAKSLLQKYFKEELQKRFYSRNLSIYQEAKGLKAWVYWQRGRKPARRSLFRYATDQKWYLARLHQPPSLDLRYRVKAPTKLERPLVESLLRKHTRKTSKRIDLLHATWFQTKPNRSLVRWQLAGAPAQLGTQGSPTRPQQGLFTHTHDGYWYFTDLKFGNPKEVLYHKKGPVRLDANIAKDLIRKYWKDQSWRSNTRRFNGARIQTLYIYQEPNSNKARAHWVINNNDQLTPVRTSFARSQEGHWYLTQYDLGPGYQYKYSKAADVAVSIPTVFALLQEYWKAKDKDNKTAFRDVYIYQREGSHQAYVHSVWITGKKARSVFSLLHRSNQNRWYLSVAELPQPPHPH